MDTLVGNAAQPLLASAAGGPVLDLDFSLVIQLGLFIVLWVALTYLVFKPYLSARHARHGLTDGTVSQSKDLQAQMQRVLSDCEAQLKDARAKAADLRDASLREASAKAKTIRDDARAAADTQQQQGLDALSKSTADARASIPAQAHQLSSAIVEKILAA
jgi:F-type H+-transporting ATPase subunit b